MAISASALPTPVIDDTMDLAQFSTRPPIVSWTTDQGNDKPNESAEPTWPGTQATFPGSDDAPRLGKRGPLLKRGNLLTRLIVIACQIIDQPIHEDGTARPSPFRRRNDPAYNYDDAAFTKGNDCIFAGNADYKNHS